VLDIQRSVLINEVAVTHHFCRSEVTGKWADQCCTDTVSLQVHGVESYEDNGFTTTCSGMICLPEGRTMTSLQTQTFSSACSST
jgi:hypothetical protein